MMILSDEFGILIIFFKFTAKKLTEYFSSYEKQENIFIDSQ